MPNLTINCQKGRFIKRLIKVVVQLCPLIRTNIISRNMEKLLFHQQELRGWEDHDQTQTYSSLYTKTNLAKNQKSPAQKKEVASEKLPQKHPLKPPKYSLNYKSHSKPITQVKFRASYEIRNDKNLLLRYLQNQPTKNQLKSHETSIQASQCILNYRKEAESIVNQLSFGKKNKEMLILTSLQTPTDETIFKELLLKGTFEIHSNKKRTIINGLNAGEDRSPRKKKKNYRTRHAIHSNLKNNLKKENRNDSSGKAEQPNQPLNKIKKFPLFFREIEWRYQQQQSSKNKDKLKYQLKMPNQISKSQMSMSYNSNENSVAQFMDTNMFTNKIRA